MPRHCYLALGIIALSLGLIGIVVPLLPTTVFVIIAAWAFAKGNPQWEAKLLENPRFGPNIRLWRERGAIPKHGKIGACVMLVLSAVAGAVALAMPYSLIPPAISLLVATWILSRPSA
jgi:uncharacterized protein